MKTQALQHRVILSVLLLQADIAGKKKLVFNSFACRFIMASNSKVKDERLQDMTVCSICHESFNEVDRIPKFLPCHHTFCSNCLTVRKPK